MVAVGRKSLRDRVELITGYNELEVVGKCINTSYVRD